MLLTFVTLDWPRFVVLVRARKYDVIIIFEEKNSVEFFIKFVLIFIFRFVSKVANTPVLNIKV
jgi:hypothetical protein